MGKFLSICAVLLVTAVSGPIPLRADPVADLQAALAPEITEIRRVINEQIAAFHAADAERAFAFSSPAIRARFQSAERFMQIVRRDYAPIYGAQSVEFGDLRFMHGQLMLPVRLHGTGGVVARAIYVVERLADGSWRIGGCYLVPGRDFEA